MKKRITACAAALVTAAAFGDVAWTNDVAILTFGWSGAVKSLVERETGRELVKPGSFVFVSVGDRLVYPSKFENPGGDLYRWTFATNGTLTMKARSFGPGWTYEVVEMSVADAKLLYLSWLNPLPSKWVSGHLNGFSDDASAVVLRSYRPEVGMHVRNKESLFLDVESRFGFVGSKGGIVAGPRGKLVGALRKMAKVGDVFHTSCSGPWALGNPRARGSYLFTEMSPGSSDDWIDLAERGGFDTIHFHNAGSRGHYFPTSVLYPNGYDDVRRCADMVHGAGMRVGLHTLTAGINPRDPWITPVCRPELIVTCWHTLSRPLGEDDTEMYVEEMPEKSHDTFHSYGTNGNTFRYRGELIQYDGIRREKPYAFTGVKRGAWKTTKLGTIPAGEKLGYLHQRYDAFYPEPGSKLADELGDQIAKLFKCGSMDLIYFDGSEGAAAGPNRRYTIDALRLGFAKKLGRDVLIEGSCTQAPDCWWYVSRYGAWDHALWGAKLFQDQHSRYKDSIRKGSLLEPQMGWWKPRQADGTARGHFLDEMEYFAKRNTADDAAMSLQGVDLRRQRITPFAVVSQMTLLGWYERFRRAHAFTPEALALFDLQGVDARLRQGADGRWTARRVDMTKRRVTKVGDGSETFEVQAKADCPAAVRVEALYCAKRSAEGVVLISPDQELQVSAAAEPKMEASLSRGDSEHGRTLVLTAANRGGTLRGSWAKWGWTTEMPYFNAKDSKSFGFWVKGDGKGETLCLQLCNSREYGRGCSDHYVKIDFTGWRYVEVLLRERDAARIEEFSWPHSNIHNMQYVASALRTEHVWAASFLMNEVPVGGSATVEVTAVVGRPIEKNATSAAAVTVNGVRHEMPFALESGDYAELDDGAWVKYSEKGVPMKRVPAQAARLRAGKNTVSYSGTASQGDARAEVTVAALGPRFAATKDFASLSADERRHLAYEAEMPVRYAPEDGFDGRVPVLVRPGERAFLELRVTGPVKNPSLSARDGTNRSWTFPVELSAEDRLFCRDGRVWYVLRPTGYDSSKMVAKGVLDEPLPALSESTGFAFSSSDPASAAAEIDVVKRYSGGRVHPNLSRKYTFGQGKSAEGSTEGILNSNWEGKEK